MISQMWTPNTTTGRYVKVKEIYNTAGLRRGGMAHHSGGHLGGDLGQAYPNRWYPEREWGPGGQVALLRVRMDWISLVCLNGTRSVRRAERELVGGTSLITRGHLGKVFIACLWDVEAPGKYEVEEFIRLFYERFSLLQYFEYIISFTFWKIFIYFWTCWVGLRCCMGFSLVVASRGYSSLRCAGFPCCGAPALGAQALAVWHMGSAVVACGLSCSTAGGFFLDQESNLCPLH